MDELAAAASVENTPMFVEEEELKPAGCEAGSHADAGMRDVLGEGTHAQDAKQGSDLPKFGLRSGASCLTLSVK